MSDGPVLTPPESETTPRGDHSPPGGSFSPAMREAIRDELDIANAILALRDETRGAHDSLATSVQSLHGAVAAVDRKIERVTGFVQAIDGSMAELRGLVMSALSRNETSAGAMRKKFDTLGEADKVLARDIKRARQLAQIKVATIVTAAIAVVEFIEHFRSFLDLFHK